MLENQKLYIGFGLKHANVQQIGFKSVLFDANSTHCAVFNEPHLYLRGYLYKADLL